MDYQETIMINKDLNISEKIAYYWLKKEHNYSFGDIKKTHQTPDFICKDGKRFEVKTCYGKNTLIFYPVQLKDIKDNDTILVVDAKKNKVVDTFLWKERETAKWKIHIPKDKYVHLRIEEWVYKLLRRTKNLYELQDDKEYSINEILDKLIKEREQKQFKLPITDKKT